MQNFCHMDQVKSPPRASLFPVAQYMVEHPTCCMDMLRIILNCELASFVSSLESESAANIIDFL